MRVDDSEKSGIINNSSSGGEVLRVDDSDQKFIDDLIKEVEHIRPFQTTILYLYSGPLGREDGFNVLAGKLGALAIMRDVLIDKHKHNLLDTVIQDELFEDIDQNKFDAAMISCPCSSFTPARNNHGVEKGPGLLRGPLPPEIYGLKDLEPTDKTFVQQGTALAIVGSRTAQSMCDQDKPWISETPMRKPDYACVHKLPEWEKVADRDGVNLANKDQCMSDARTTKPTEFLHYRVDLTHIPEKCNHEWQSWTVPWSGKTYMAPHPRLRGKQWAIPTAQWTRDMLRWYEPTGPYITKESAFYPGLLNARLVFALVCGAKKLRMQRQQTDSMIVTGKYHNHMIRTSKLSTIQKTEDSIFEPQSIIFHQPLRPRAPTREQRKTAEELNALGGMRRPKVSVQKVKGHQSLGPIIFDAAMDFLDRHPMVEADILRALENGNDDTQVPSAETLQPFLSTLANIVEATDVEPSSSLHDDCCTDIRGGLLEAWAVKAGDIGANTARWCKTGAPAGIEEDFELEGIFPVADPEDIENPDELECDPETFTNYDGFDDDQEAVEEILKFKDKQYLKEFDSLADLKTYFNGKDPILSRFGCITRTKNGRLKKRIILDLKQSNITKCTKRKWRAILPRMMDLVADTLDLSCDLEAKEECIEFLVLDFVDAFWNIPLSFKERRYFVGKVRQKFYVYLRSAQGSRNAPLSWATIISLVGRCTQSVFWKRPNHKRAPEDVRLEIYVDDPAICARGTKIKRDRNFCIIVLIWRTLGFNLAFSKAKRGTKVPWIGNLIWTEDAVVKGAIQTERVEELKSIIEQVAKSNVISVKDLRSLAGKGSNFATLLFTWRPFLSELWAALKSTSNDTKKSDAPANCIWTKQIQHTLRWLKAFLDECSGMIERTWSVQNYAGMGHRLRMITDACPWGMGGLFLVDEVIIGYFAVEINQFELMIFKCNIGDAAGQQIWEALAILIGLRLFKKEWQLNRATLEVRADNVAALSMVMTMKAKGGLNLVARELALDLADGSFRPNLAKHIPGICNTCADSLSRKFCPNVVFKLPECLNDVAEYKTPPRNATYYRAIVPPNFNATAEQKGTEGAASQ